MSSVTFNDPFLPNPTSVSLFPQQHACPGRFHGLWLCRSDLPHAAVTAPGLCVWVKDHKCQPLSMCPYRIKNMIRNPIQWAVRPTGQLCASHSVLVSKTVSSSGRAVAQSLCTADASPPTNVQSWGCGSILSLHLLFFPMSSAVAILLCMSGEVVVDTLAICKARQALQSVQVCSSPTLMLPACAYGACFQLLMFICREVWITVIVLHVLREATLSNLPWLGVSYQRPSSVQSL